MKTAAGGRNPGRPFSLATRDNSPMRLAILAALLVFFGWAQPLAAGAGWPTPENPVDILRVVKSKRLLEAWRDGIKVRTYRISLGSNPFGHKLFEGDGRTPEGSYTLDYRKADSVAYKAMHISYPSQTDRQRARQAGLKPGGAIMLHGQWNGFGWFDWLLQNYDWTNGCIGLSNKDIDELWEIVAWNTTIEILP